MVEIAFGKKVPATFKTKVIEICNNLQCDPSHLMACMAFETGERFSAKTRNPTSGATGLIQFMKTTAEHLGTTIEALAAMTEVEQLDYVEKYFRPYKGKLDSLSDVYMVILWPKAVGRDDAYVLFPPTQRQYDQNKGLDANRDGVVTKGEAAAKVHNKLVRGLGNGFRG